MKTKTTTITLKTLSPAHTLKPLGFFLGSWLFFLGSSSFPIGAKSAW